MRRLLSSAGILLAIAALAMWVAPDRKPVLAAADGQPIAGEDRSPVDVVITRDGQWLLTANQTSDSLSLVRIETGQVVQELPVGHRPAAVVLTPDEQRVLVSGTYSGELSVFELGEARLTPVGEVLLGFEPRGIAVSPDNKLAYVALTTANAVAVVDLERLAEVERIEVERWPRYLALNPDGSRLAVGTSGDRSMSVVDTASRKMIFTEPFSALNQGQMQASQDGKYVYVPWMVYRHNPITAGNIRLGWVLASRIAKVRIDEPSRRLAISLDPRGKAVSDPHGLALTSDERWMVCAASGTQELLIYKVPGLPFQDFGGPGDHIDNGLLRDRERFSRVELGGRPMGLAISPDDRSVYVANYLLNAVQVVDLAERKLVRTIPLGSAAEVSLARRGEAIFYDGRRSLDQWYSCHSCHYEGGTNATAMDTLNDGTIRTFKTVLNLRNVHRTPPWTWHGWQTDLDAAMRKSLTSTMLGPEPSNEDVQALSAFLQNLETPPNPYRQANGTLTEAAARGQRIFEGEKAGCTTCHSGELFTDGQVHDVGTGRDNDRYPGYNTPSLLGAYSRVRYLHDGRVKTLEEVLTGPHDPNAVTGGGKLTQAELQDLIEYVKSL